MTMSDEGQASRALWQATCAGCGTTVVFAAHEGMMTKRCTGCGAPVNSPQKVNAPTPVRGHQSCPNCLKPLRPGARICIYCGHNLRTQASAAPVAGSNILVIDDDPVILSSVSSLLRAQGHRVTTSGDAVSALGAARRERPDLIVLDLGLPGGDGLTVMDRIRSIDSLSVTPIIILSSKEPETAGREAMERGARIFVQKPLDPQHFRATVSLLLGHGSQSQD